MQNIYLQALEQQACSRGLNIHFTDIRPGFVDTALLSGDFRYPMKLRPLLAISDDDTLGIGSDCAARHIDGCPTARGTDSRVGAVETGVVARIAAAVVARLRHRTVCHGERALGHLHDIVVGRGCGECLIGLTYLRTVGQGICRTCGCLR